MRMRSIMIKPVLLAITVAAAAACVERTPELLQSGKINYSVDVAGCIETKGALYNEAAELKDAFFTVDGYNTGDGSQFLSREKVRYVGDSWLADTDKNWPEGKSLTFYANANVPSSSVANVTSTKDGQTLTYTDVPASASSQNDIMLGYYSGNGGGTNTADIVMYHPLTSVVFRLGEIVGFTDSDKITKISISGVYKSGVCTATYSSSGPSFSWTHDEKVKQVVSDEAAGGLVIESGEKKNIGTPFVIIPQNIATDKAYLSLTLTLGGVENELTCRLSGSEWKSGVTAVYEINYDPVNFGLSVTRWDETDPVDVKASYYNSADWVRFSAPTSHSVKIIDDRYLGKEDPNFAYSYDGNIWLDYTMDTFIEFGGSKGAVYFRGENPGGTRGCSFSFDTDEDEDAEHDVDVAGNVMSLIGRDIFSAELGTYAFSKLFSECVSIVDASNLVLPAEKLSDNCYEDMFIGCVNLVAVPELPATMLAPGCYSYMFAGCENLSIAPALPATKMEILCYQCMFCDCLSLADAPALPATILARDCYNGMFSACPELKVAPELPATILADGCYSQMFECTGLTSAPALPATTLEAGCYKRMFWWCEELLSAPSLPAATLAPDCYNSMFTHCTKLSEIQMMATDISAEGCLDSWTEGVAPTGTFTKNVLATWPEADVIPEGWTVKSTASNDYLCFSSPTEHTVSLVFEEDMIEDILGHYYIDMGALNLQYSYDAESWMDYEENTSIEFGNGKVLLFKGCNTTMHNHSFRFDTDFVEEDDTKDICVSGNVMSLLGENATVIAYAFRFLFAGCSSIVDASNLILPEMELRPGCYSYMFLECRNLKYAPKLPATKLANECYSNMFAYCISLSQCPELPALSLADSCYHGMFLYCISLESAPELLSMTLATSCYNRMFGGCYNLKVPPRLPAERLEKYCYQYMFGECESLESAPELPSMTMAEACYSGMFYGCTSLKESPVLPANKLERRCYEDMFLDCSSLNRVTVLAPYSEWTSLDEDCFLSIINGMLDGVSSTGTLYIDSSFSEHLEIFDDFISEGWTVLFYQN